MKERASAHFPRDLTDVTVPFSKLLRLVSIVVFLHVLSACRKETLVDANNKEELEKIIRSEYTRLELPGVVCLAVKQDSVVFEGAEGFADLEKQVRFTTQTRMQIASISKTFVATAIMQLLENGSLDLDENISSYLPFHVVNPRHPSEKITVRMLLTHTSSISDEGYLPSSFYLFEYKDYPEPLMSFEKNYLTQDGMYYSKKNFSTSKPPANYAYSNVGAALLACIVENVSGMDYNTYCKVRIFNPLGMTKTTWFYSETPKEEMAILYADNNFTHPSKPFFSYPTYPDGHLITTADDLSKFMRAYILGGTFRGFQLLTPTSVDEILREYFAFSGVNDQGLIFYKHKLANYTVWGHDGGDPGISTEMYFDREKKIGYIMFNNRSEAYSEVVANALLTYANK